MAYIFAFLVSNLKYKKSLDKQFYKICYVMLSVIFILNFIVHMDTFKYTLYKKTNKIQIAIIFIQGYRL